jgi:rSAM/selenodomain-associated transferase 1
MPHSPRVAARLLFVFSKEPRPGSVKTRMCPPLSAEQAARCHTAFLGDLLARVVEMRANTHVVLAATPDGNAPVLAAMAKEHGIELGVQGPGDLGARMTAALARAERDQAEALVIGSDSPDLPMEFINEAFAAVAPRTIVIGPADDGGFYLIGRGPGTLLSLDGIAWGKPTVLEETIARAGRAGLSVRLLPQWYDVDDASGLSRLASRLSAPHARESAAKLPRTTRLIDELEGEGIWI